MIMTLKEAKKFLTEKGMTLNPIPSLTTGRQYWWFNDGHDVFLDHTATITPVGKGQYYVSDFTYLKEK